MVRLVALALLLSCLSVRADYQDGVDAYNRGEYAAALAEFRDLADKGVVIAYTNLGYMHALGEGVEQDLETAADWFLKAAQAGSVGAQMTVGSLFFHGEGVERNLPLAYGWFNVAATNGRSDALDYMSVVLDRMSFDEAEEAQRTSRRLFERCGNPDGAGFLKRPVPPSDEQPAATTGS